MANRSYIYGVSNNKHMSIGECPYNIPYAFKILASYDNKVVDSELFDKVVGLKANFRKGKEGLFYLLDFLSQTGQMKDEAAFNEDVIKTKAFLNQIDADEILLENGEIYALYKNKEGNYLDGKGMEKTNEFEREDYQWIGEDITNLKSFNIRPDQIFNLNDEKLEKLFKWIIDLKDDWKKSLGLDCWGSVLYFQFKDEV